MRDSLFFSATKALMVAFFTMVGLFLGVCVMVMGIGTFSTKSSSDSRLTSVTTEEILPNAEGKEKCSIKALLLFCKLILMELLE